MNSSPAVPVPEGVRTGMRARTTARSMEIDQ
jgi:hypothetical protein